MIGAAVIASKALGRVGAAPRTVHAAVFRGSGIFAFEIAPGEPRVVIGDYLRAEYCADGRLRLFKTTGRYATLVAAENEG